MASFRKRKTRNPAYQFQASIFVHGVRKSRSFSTAGAAKAWAAKEEAQILAGERGEIPDKTLGDLLERYATDVIQGHEGRREDAIRIKRLQRDKLATVPLRRLDATHVADWRDRRCKEVSGASCRREWNLLSAACGVAIMEWKWLRGNPFKGVRRPKGSKPRTRVLEPGEMERLEAVANSETRRNVIRAAKFALETGMRAGEICGLESIAGVLAVLAKTKNGDMRVVPLSDEAVRLWNEGPLNLLKGTRDTIWRRMLKEAGINGLTFHDLRRTFATRAANVLNPYELSKALGHKNLSMTLNTYYADDPAAIARKLNPDPAPVAPVALRLVSAA